MDVSLRFDTSVLVVEVAGEIDSATIRTMRDALDAATAADVDEIAVDLSRVRFFGSAALSALTDAARTVQGRGGRLTLRNPPPMAERVLQITDTEWLARA